MQTTQQVLQKLKGSKVVLCRACKTSVLMPTSFIERQIEDDLIEMGLECPNCKYWFHSFFLNHSLIATRPQPTDDRKIRREYKSKFGKFNKQTRKRLGMKKVNGKWS